jgi:C-methyltransferase C-terminal domain/Putative zinc binding domain/Methyltransferase domain
LTVGIQQVKGCRFCGGALSISFCDLGMMPLANSYVSLENAHTPDPVFPLHARVCERCFLVQLDHVVDARDIFSDYAYFSSFSSGWLAHARRFAHEMIRGLPLGPKDFVVEVASNDGYLLKNFVEAGIPCLGIEPAENVAQAARAAGVPTETCFFGRAVAEIIVARHGHAKLVIGNNVLAHVPDVSDFVGGMACLAGVSGMVSVEVPHLLELVRRVEFDTIYHEHYSYWSLHALEAVFEAHGLSVIHVQELPTHGGSIRVLACASSRPASPQVNAVRQAEAAAGITGLCFYQGFAPRVRRVLEDFRDYLESARRSGRRVAGYGAAAKANTFLNAGGPTATHLICVADRSPHKQHRLLPGTRIPVVAPDTLVERRPDDIVILAWNMADEIMRQMTGVARWGARFVMAIPKLQILVAK